ncbi:hypothetical protein EDC01DRAFT_700168 [Geopyxis carbonaria]|nr:hypothetical protein EDC01DRAFT_700168 [Geopyxis carbonaria]
MPMETHSRLLILLLITLIIFLTPSTPPPNSHTRTLIAASAHRLALLRNSTYGHPGNRTALGLPEGGVVPPEGVREVWRGVKKGVLGAAEGGRGGGGGRGGWGEGWENATGTVMGEWTRLAEGGKGKKWGGEGEKGEWQRNLTAGVDAGRITVTIEDTRDTKQAGEVVREVAASVSVQDADGAGMVAVRLMGVHWPRSGEMVLASTSERFGGLFALPHFVDNAQGYNDSKTLLLKTLGAVIARQERTLSADAPWVDVEEFDETLPRCDYIAYLQLHPVPATALFLDVPASGAPAGLVSQTMRRIERELRMPTGETLPAPPPLVASALLYSPTCGVALSTDAMRGEKLELIRASVSRLGLGAAAVAAAQTALLIRQMNESATPSTVSRVSFWTIVMLAVVDGYWFFVFMVAAIYIDACYLPLFTASFVHLVLLSMFEMRFLVQTYRVQRPERPTPPDTPTPTAAPTPTPPPAPAALPPGTLPLPATAATPPTPPPSTASQIRTEISALHTRFYLLLLLLLFLTLHSLTWPPRARETLLLLLLTATNSPWLPQLYRNILRGSRKPFTAEFVAGTALCRLAPAAYLFLYAGNVFRVAPRPGAVLALAAWEGVQAAALGVHAVLGPRFGVPAGWAPEVFEYHTPLPDAETGEGGADGRDCAICMQPVEAPVGARDGGEEAVGLLERRAHMVTPCRHVFHTPCLEGWMRYRLQCPICRTALPAL